MTRAPLRHMKKTVEPEVIADSCLDRSLSKAMAPVEKVHVIYAVYASNSFDSCFS